MAWIRLSDDYTDHPKFDNLSDGAFRLWHQGLGFCRKFQTDGSISLASLRKLKAFTEKRKTELMTPWADGKHALWQPHTGGGITMHGYLKWNLSKDEESSDRDEAAKRMRRLRKTRSDASCSPEHRGERSPDVPGRDGVLSSSSEKGSGEKPFVRGAIRLAPPPEPEIAARAGLLLERYAELFIRHRRGARLKPAPALDFPKACDVCATWPDDERIEKLAVIVLTTDDDWISRTDRGFSIFASKATWADDRLAAWEAAQARTA